MKKRIIISGPSGAGKTTLARFLSREYYIPFISTSAKELWPKYNIHNHEQLINLCASDKQFAVNFQFELLHLRNSKLEGIDQYVTDRGPMDNLVYFLSQVSHMVPEIVTAKYIDECVSSQHQYCKQQILLCSPKNHNQVENDGARVNSLYYQWYIQSIFMHVATDMDYLKMRVSNIAFFPTDLWGFQQRENLIKGWLD